MNHNAGYYIERLTKEKLGDIAVLHHAVYGKKIPVSFFVKKYNTAFTGIGYIGLIAYSDHGIPVAYYGVIPCFLHDGDNMLLAAQSADTMTHPGYRFKGLFVELSLRVFDLCREEKIPIVFGFPNQHSLNGAINKLGWRMTETMDCFIIPVKALPLEKVSGKNVLLKKMYRKYTQWVLRKYRSPWVMDNSVIQDGYAGVYRDAAYWKYKTYYDRSVIRIGESLVWIKINNGLIIGDMNVTGDFYGLMASLQKLAAKLGLTEIQLHTSQGTGLHQLLIKQWQPIPSFPVLFQDFGSGWELNRIKFNFADIDIF